MESTMSVKGQFTLPKALREIWHLKTGDKIIFEEIENVGYVIRPRITNVLSLKGCVSYQGKLLTIDEMNDAIAVNMKDHL